MTTNKKTTQPLSELVAEELKASGNNFSRVARGLGLNYYALRELYGDQVQALPEDNTPTPDDITTLGKPSLRKFVVAVKRPGRSWDPNHMDAIKRARKQYDTGTHEVAQGLRNGWIVLYAIPRLIPAKPRIYFQSMVPM